MVLAEFSMYPTDKGASVSQYVAPIIDIIDKSGLSYTLTPMGTVIEGQWGDVMNVISACFKQLEPLSERIACQIKIDYRRGENSRMHSKIEKVAQLLGREVMHSTSPHNKTAQE
ncbi:MTH1187 family thiamine-binding protein [candidate division KSB1 bacterium]|nr:MTH1187 family thiamine-binding protein [candidate division KSB1 bacterium]